MSGTGETSIFVSRSRADIIRIASSAKRMRDALNLSPEKAVPILDVLEFRIPAALKDFRLVIDFDNNFDRSVLAMTRRIPPEIIVRESVYQHAAINSKPARVILAHELGHLWLGHGQSASKGVQIRIEERSLHAEWEADEFAAELLMPSKIALKLNSDQLARQFVVPLQTAKTRLRALKNRQKNPSLIFEEYSGLLSRAEKEVLHWLPMGWQAPRSAEAP